MSVNLSSIAQLIIWKDNKSTLLNSFSQQYQILAHGTISRISFNTYLLSLLLIMVRKLPTYYVFLHFKPFLLSNLNCLYCKSTTEITT